jgi:hypothetical protein
MAFLSAKKRQEARLWINLYITRSFPVHRCHEEESADMPQQRLTQQLLYLASCVYFFPPTRATGDRIHPPQVLSHQVVVFIRFGLQMRCADEGVVVFELDFILLLRSTFLLLLRSTLAQQKNVTKYHNDSPFLLVHHRSLILLFQG